MSDDATGKVASSNSAAVTVEARSGGLLAARFSAMASPCEVLLATQDQALAQGLGALAAAEAWRIEAKFSRYRTDSVIGQINRHAGERRQLDAETAQLLEFAHQCYQLSDGLFDITCGVLRRVWKFDGSDRVPTPEQVRALLPLIGFNRLDWQRPWLGLPEGMELDLGGIGKEYAVDRACELLHAQTSLPLLVNFGGDMRATSPPPGGRWQVGVERPGSERDAAMILELEHGALTTSGDARRYLMRDGVRYGHILDPRTGWPVPAAPRSVTVAASSCTEAGLLSTLALLHGAEARHFLDQQQVPYWVLD